MVDAGTETERHRKVEKEGREGGGETENEEGVVGVKRSKVVAFPLKCGLEANFAVLRYLCEYFDRRGCNVSLLQYKAVCVCVCVCVCVFVCVERVWRMCMGCDVM